MTVTLRADVLSLAEREIVLKELTKRRDARNDCGALRVETRVFVALLSFLVPKPKHGNSCCGNKP